MRGNRSAHDLSWADFGSIPAHAGKPPGPPCHLTCYRVYPRACGETPTFREWVGERQGLSPRMRGNQGRPPGRGPGCGSIPAHAGKPDQSLKLRALHWVYPRACGETLRTGRCGRSGRGLSPRMRGNLLAKRLKHELKWSIPAHAGKPSLDLCPVE